MPDRRPSPLTPSAGDLEGVRSPEQPLSLEALSDSLILCWQAGPLPIRLRAGSNSGLERGLQVPVMWGACQRQAPRLKLGTVSVIYPFGQWRKAKKEEMPYPLCLVLWSPYKEVTGEGNHRFREL